MTKRRRMPMKRQRILERAVRIAAAVLLADGVCTRDEPCRGNTARYSDDKCVACLERWLCAKAEEELRKEDCP